MHKMLAVLGIVSIVSLPLHVWAGDKITICHATSSVTNPYVKITVSTHAEGAHFDEHGTPLAGHEQDILLQGDVECPGPVIPPPIDPPVEPPATTTPPVATTTPPVDPIPPVDPTPTDTGHPGGSGGVIVSGSSHGGGASTDGKVAGAECTAFPAPQNLAIDTGIPNDHTLEIYWTPIPDASEVELRWGNENGVWTHDFVTGNTGHYSLTGLTNGKSYWVAVKANTDCSEWADPIDPLP